MDIFAARRERKALYDADTRDLLRYGAPLIAALLVFECVAHIAEAPPAHFTIACMLGAAVIAPLGGLANRDQPFIAIPIRWWPLWPWLVCMVVLGLHLEPFTFDATTYLIVALNFGVAALIISPGAFAIAFGSLSLTLVWWLIRAPAFDETEVFALLSMPLAGAVYWARRRSLLLAEEQRRLEQALARQQDEVALARRVLDINRGLTHHFNNVFSGIVGGASLALEQLEDDHPAREAMTVALSSGEHGSEIIARLGFSGSDASEEITEFDARALFDAPEITARVPRSCRFDIVTTPDLPMLSGQRERLTEAVGELVANAVEALEDEAGTIRVDISTGVRSDRIEMVVSDSGVGMSEAEVQRCVEPFYTTRDPSRRGLGLAFVLGVVERHAGSIQIDSAPGGGTRVRVELPIAR